MIVSLRQNEIASVTDAERGYFLSLSGDKSVLPTYEKRKGLRLPGSPSPNRLPDWVDVHIHPTAMSQGQSASGWGIGMSSHQEGSALKKA